jgi:DNA-binding MarR family transcriptional regulator
MNDEIKATESDEIPIETNVPEPNPQNPGTQTDIKHAIEKPGWAKRSVDDKIHSFSADLAIKYSIPGAIILGYLAYVLNRKKNLTEGKKRYFITLDELAEQYPYLGRTSIDDSLKALQKAKVLEITRHNKRSFDRTRWYAIVDDEISRLLRHKRIYFSKQDAVEYGGVVAAAVLMNLMYWLRENRKKKPDYAKHKMSPKELAKVMPFTEAQIKRSLARLVELKVITKIQMPGLDRTNFYSLTDPTRLGASDESPKSIVTNVGSKEQKLVSIDLKTDADRANPENHSAISDNNTILIDNVERQPLKDNVERQHVEDCAVPISPSLPSTKEEQASEVKTTKTAFEELKYEVEVCEEGSEESKELIRDYVAKGAYKTVDEEMGFSQLAYKVFCADSKYVQALERLYRNYTIYTTPETLYSYLTLSEVDCYDCIFKRLRENDYWQGVNYNKEDGSVIYYTFGWSLAECFQFYKNEKFETKYPETVSNVHLLFNKLHPYYEKNYEQLKANKLDHLKSFMQLREEEKGSPDKHLEHDPDQEPEIKAKVLNNGIHAMNRIGKYIEGEIDPSEFDASPAAIKAAQKLFAANPKLTPGYLLRLMRDCEVRIDENQSKRLVDGKELPYCLKKAKNLGPLLGNLSECLKVCGMIDCDCPITDFLTNEIMFEKKSE